MALCEWFPNLIYVEGGNTFWLHHCMTKGDWTDDLVTAITTRNAVYCGKSAGAILVGHSVETATWKVCRENVFGVGQCWTNYEISSTILLVNRAGTIRR